MTDKKVSRVEFYPPNEPTTQRYRLIGSRLATEHDMNDAMFARLDFVDKYNKIVHTEKEQVAHKTEKKIHEGRLKKIQNLWPIIIISQFIAVFEIYVMKVVLHLF